MPIRKLLCVAPLLVGCSNASADAVGVRVEPAPAAVAPAADATTAIVPTAPVDAAPEDCAPTAGDAVVNGVIVPLTDAGRPMPGNVRGHVGEALPVPPDGVIQPLVDPSNGRPLPGNCHMKSSPENCQR